MNTATKLLFKICGGNINKYDKSLSLQANLAILKAERNQKDRNKK